MSNRTFQVFQQSLKWVAPLILRGSAADLDLARALVHRWAVDNAGSTPMVSRDIVWSGWVVGLRATTLACLRLATGGYPEIDALLRRHIRELDTNYEGAWNHGFVQDVGIVAAGCVLGDHRAVERGDDRVHAGIPEAIDSQGATQEQAPYYASYVRNILTNMRQALLDCSPTPPSVHFERVSLMPRFMAHATQPNGRVTPIGDSSGEYSGTNPGTPLEYPLSLGRRGTPLEDRVAVYRAGYVFARSGWGSAQHPYQAQDYWTLRFGPPRTLHGHQDHTSITMFARGRPLIIDTGFKDYVDMPFRLFSRTPQAHNVTVVAGAIPRNGRTDLMAKHITARDETFAVAGRPYVGVTRRRTVFAAHDVPVTLVVDRTTADRHRTFTQLWHVHPDLAQVAVSSRGAQFLAGNTKLRVVPVTWPGHTRARVGIVSGQRRPMQGWLLSNDGTARRAPVISFTSAGRQRLQLALIMATRPSARVQWSITPARGSRAKLTVKVADSTLVLLIDGQTGWVTRL